MFDGALSVMPTGVLRDLQFIHAVRFVRALCALDLLRDFGFWEFLLILFGEKGFWMPKCVFFECVTLFGTGWHGDVFILFINFAVLKINVNEMCLKY